MARTCGVRQDCSGWATDRRVKGSVSRPGRRRRRRRWAANYRGALCDEPNATATTEANAARIRQGCGGWAKQLTGERGARPLSRCSLCSRSAIACCFALQMKARLLIVFPSVNCRTVIISPVYAFRKCCAYNDRLLYDRPDYNSVERMCCFAVVCPEPFPCLPHDNGTFWRTAVIKQWSSVTNRNVVLQINSIKKVLRLQYARKWFFLDIRPK